MPLITNADEIKRAAEIADVIGRRIVLKPSHGHLEGSCPFHSSRSGRSFHVNPAKQSWYCWGCRKGGTAVSFLMDFEHLDYPGALELLAAECGIAVEYASGGPVPDGQHHAPPRQMLQEAVYKACHWYESQLRASSGKAAMEYAAARGLKPAILEKYNIGYAHGATVSESADTALLEAAGILHRTGDGRLVDRLAGRLVIPLCDTGGRPVAFTGRLISSADAPKYVNTPETPLFHKGRLLFGYHHAHDMLRSRLRRRIVYIIEGQLKCIAMLEAGYPCVAAGGTAFTPSQVALVSHLADKAVIVPDPDEAGEKAAVEIASALRSAGLEAAIGLLDRSANNLKDPDDFMARGLDIKVDEFPVVAWLYRRIANDRVQTVEEAARVCREVVPFIRANPMPAVVELELRQLSKLSGLPVAALEPAQNPQVPMMPPRQPQQEQQEGVAISTAMTSDRMLIAQCLQVGPQNNPDWPAYLPILELPPFCYTAIKDLLWTFRYSVMHGVSVADALAMTVPADRLPYYQYWLSVDIGDPPTQETAAQLAAELVQEGRDRLSVSAAQSGAVDLAQTIQAWR